MVYIWHQVSEKEKEEIRKEAKNLLDDFSSKIERISVKDRKIEERENLRIEGDGWETNQEFKEFMFDNAPLIEDNLIIAERGTWKK